MKLSLPAIALRRPVTVVMVVMTMLGLGFIAYLKIPVEFIPKLELPFIRCYIPYAGATPAQVENEVARPAEGQFRTVSQLKRISTTSNSNGCDVSLMFDWDADMVSATAEVRDRMERLKLELPEDIERMVIRRFSSTSMPVMMFALFREGDAEELSHLVKTVLQSRLMRIEGVADVQVFGKPEKSVLVEFDQQLLRSRNLSLYQVVSLIQKSSLNVSVGELEDGETSYLVRVLDEFTTPEEIGRLVVGPGAVRLRDVANVSYRSRERESYFAIDGKDGCFIMVRKESEANTISTCGQVREEIEALGRDPVFKGVDYFMFFDQAEIILSALEGLMKAGQFGGCLSFLVLLIFLRRLRPTLVVALAIPGSLVAAFVFIYFAGMTLNLITMLSMIIALGMLVDNSIVVIENIYRHNQLGRPHDESAKRGATEVGMAITAATLTTVVVFIPILYLDAGEMSTYMHQFAIPVTVALGASLALALTIIPLAASRMKPREQLRMYQFIASRSAGVQQSWPWRAAGKLHDLLKAFLSGLMDSYAWTLAWATNWRLATVLILAFMWILTLAIPVRKVGTQGMPEADSRQVEIRVILDQNFDLEKTGDTFKTLQALVDEQREELGIENVFSQYSAGGGNLYLILTQEDDLEPGEKFPYETEEVRDILWQRLPHRVPGGELRFEVAESGDSSERGFQVRLRGDDFEILRRYAERFAGLVENIKYVGEVHLDTERDTQEVQVEVNEPMADRHGVSALVIARTVDFALRGIRLPYMKKDGREIPVMGQFREEDRKSRSNLENVGILNQDSELVPLEQLVSFGKARGAKAINRVDGKNVVTMIGMTDDKHLSSVVKDLKNLIDSFDMPLGYSIQMGDQLVELEANTQSFFTALLMAVVLIYLVMGALFESYLLPLSILTTVPQAMIGVYWGMYLTRTPLDLVTMIGIILMVGIVVNNGIVIVDHINQLRNNGMERSQAIIQAGRDRLRPVMMTALTTILGCVPLAIGTGNAGGAQFPGLGRALIGGLTTGTLLTLFLVPVFYTLIDDLRAWAVQFLSGVVRILMPRAA